MPARSVLPLAVLLGLSVGVAPGRAAAGPRAGALVVGLVPETNVFRQRSRFEPLEAWLTSDGGIAIHFTTLAHHGDALEALEAGRLDGALLGSFAGAIAIERLGAIPVARLVSPDGASTYRGVLVVRRDSGLRTAGQLRGKKMAFVDRATSAGWLFPLAWLREQGVPGPDGFFSESWFAGSHDAAVAAVLDRSADVGATKSTVLEGMRAEDPRVARDLLVLASSPAFPSNTLFLRRDTDPAVVARLRKALLELERAPGGAEVLSRVRAARFGEASAADYRPVHEIAAKAGVRVDRFRPEQRAP
jgi:phosphonate transport system substrate-binding protein